MTCPVRSAAVARATTAAGRVPPPIPAVPGQLAIPPTAVQLALPDPGPEPQPADPGQLST